MAYIVIENCQDCMFTDCVEVCPVDCFYEARDTDRMLYINPNECIDCGACVPECPVQAIFAEDDVPEGQKQWIEINKEKTLAGNLAQITTKIDPLPTAEEKKKALGL